MRIMAVALVLVLLIAAFFVNHHRDTIALKVANAALGDSDIVVTDVSVDSIRADYIQFDEIALELGGGNIALVENVSLPVKLRNFAGSTLHIDRVTVLQDDADTDPPQLGTALRSYLNAPTSMSGGTVVVDELRLPDMPVIHDVGWYADELNPTLRASIGEFGAFLTFTATGPGDYRASLRVLTPDDTEAVMLGFRIRDQLPPHYHMEGKLVLRLEPLLPVLHALGAVPEDIRDLTGTLGGTFETRVTDTLPIPVSVGLTDLSKLNLEYRDSDETTMEITVKESGTVGATVEYPSLDWSTHVENVELLVSAAGFDEQPVSLRNVRCQSGLHCKTSLSASLGRLNIGALSLDDLTFFVESMQLTSTDGQWQVLSDNAKVTLQNTRVAGRQFVVPDATAEIGASNEELSAVLHFSTPEAGFTGRAELRHNLSRGTGEVHFRDTALNFDILNLSEVVTDWPYEFDVSSGFWRIDAGVNWAVTDAGFAYTGTTLHSLDSLAGNYGDIGFIGLNSQTEVKIDWQAGISLSPTQFEVALIDVGFPVRELRGRFAADIGSLAADVETVSMAALGGIVTVDPFRYEHTADNSQLILSVKEIQLPLMVGLAGLKAMEISGSVSGDIPVTLKNGKVIIDRGLLENDPPGGVIRYGAGAGVVDDESQLGIVTRTLRNFEYDTLTSEVSYTDSGDLKLQMRLTGTNPDVDPNQPIVLNLGVENNVPQMLRSLQATRSIEDVLEERLGK